MLKVTLKTLRKEGVEITSFKVYSYVMNGVRYEYAQPNVAYIFYYENEYILYTHIIHSPNIMEYDNLEEAYNRLSHFITDIVNPFK